MGRLLTAGQVSSCSFSANVVRSSSSVRCAPSAVHRVNVGLGKRTPVVGASLAR